MTINAERPRKGVFEVRVKVDGTAVDGGITAVIASTGPEARPFPDLKALDVDAIATSAVDTAKALEG